jgi:hypothetical protein
MMMRRSEFQWALQLGDGLMATWCRAAFSSFAFLATGAAKERNKFAYSKRHHGTTGPQAVIHPSSIVDNRGMTV